MWLLIAAAMAVPVDRADLPPPVTVPEGRTTGEYVEFLRGPKPYTRFTVHGTSSSTVDGIDSFTCYDTPVMRFAPFFRSIAADAPAHPDADFGSPEIKKFYASALLAPKACNASASTHGGVIRVTFSYNEYCLPNYSRRYISFQVTPADLTRMAEILEEYAAK